MPIFEATKRKVDLTEHQLLELETGIVAFFQTNPCTWESSIDPDHGILSFAAHSSGQIPLDLTLLLGEVITNLRSVLDHAASELIGIDTKTEDIKMTFPTATKQAEYVARCRDIKTRRDDTKAFFMNLAVYPDGAGKVLCALDQLDAAGKRTVLTPVVGVAKIGPIKVLNSDGSPASTAASMECSMEIDGRTRLINLGASKTVEIDKGAKPTFDIFFGDVGQFKFHRIIPTLRLFETAVKDTVRRFERFVTTRF
ncbi:MAG: hypothetical protein WBR29_05680 [Gammaproteobacteria bacterium]